MSDRIRAYLDACAAQAIPDNFSLGYLPESDRIVIGDLRTLLTERDELAALAAKYREALEDLLYEWNDGTKSKAAKALALTPPAALDEHKPKICWHCGETALYKRGGQELTIHNESKGGKNPDQFRCPTCDDWGTICNLQDSLDEQRKREAEIHSRAIEEFMDDNSIECGNCSFRYVPIGHSTIEDNMDGMSPREGEDLALCGYCMQLEWNRWEAEIRREVALACWRIARKDVEAYYAADEIADKFELEVPRTEDSPPYPRFEDIRREVAREFLVMIDEDFVLFGGAISRDYFKEKVCQRFALDNPSGPCADARVNLKWNTLHVIPTGEYRVPHHGELFMELPDGNKPLRVLESHPAFFPDGPRIIVISAYANGEHGTTEQVAGGSIEATPPTEVTDEQARQYMEKMPKPKENSKS